MNETICAIATGGGSSAIAVIRISGEKALAIAREIGSAVEYPHRKAVYCTLRDGDGDIDQALVTHFSSPNSYTGEDLVEMSVHGSPFIQKRLMRACMNHGARMAEPGEFTKRAFLNGKLDLAQAEAVGDLIAARGAKAHELAFSQLKGEHSAELKDLRQRLLHLTSLIELELDFSTEDVEFADRTELRTLLLEVLKRVEAMAATFETGNAIREGVPVAILGAPNVGKSTLLNALLKEERAIVSDIPGTTRDVLEGQIEIGGISFRFIDTAGIRETEDTIEKQGIERAYGKADEARIVVMLFNADAFKADEAKWAVEAMADRFTGQEKLIIPVINKVDLMPDLEIPDGFITISAKKREGLDALTGMLEGWESEIREQESIVITHLRHYEALMRCEEALKRAEGGLVTGVPTDLLAQDLRDALVNLGSITGEITPDEILGNIFANFCIGK